MKMLFGKGKKSNQEKIKLKDFLVPVTLNNCDSTGNNYELKCLQTTDFVYLQSKIEAEKQKAIDNIFYPTDYAIIKGVLAVLEKSGFKKQAGCRQWLRSRENEFIHTLSSLGEFKLDDPFAQTLATRPCVQIHIKKFLSVKDAPNDYLKITLPAVRKDDFPYYTTLFGEFPQTYVGNELNDELEKLFTKKRLKKTGKSYIGHYEFIPPVLSKIDSEYAYQGQKYVRVKNNISIYITQHQGACSLPQDKEYFWVKVEPIMWRINNWDDLPKSINPLGTGKANTIVLQSLYAINSNLPFYNSVRYNIREQMWQNSLLRAYFNSYDLQEEILKKGNGEKYDYVGENYDFKNKGFLNEAFDQEVLVDLSSIQNEQDCTCNEESKKTLSSTEIARNELLKKALERRKQSQRLNVNNNDEQNENVM